MNVERFNEVYNQFITTLTKKFKFGEKEMSKKMSVAIENDPKHYVDMFIKNLLPHIDEVSACNIDFFRFSKSSILLLIIYSIPGLRVDTDYSYPFKMFIQ